MLAHFFDACSVMFSFKPILMIFFGTFIGIVIGALPGLSATMGMAIFSPMTYFMSPTLGIPFLLGLYKGGTYGGSISAILINTPGTASNAATTMDGYPLAQKGRAGYALTAALKASLVGDFFGTAVLVFVAPQLARIALKFGPPEIFSLILFSLMFVCIGQRGSLVKAWLSAAVGIGLSIIGQDPITGYPRFTFGSFELQVGVDLIAICIGLFGFAEILIQSEKTIVATVNQIKKSMLGTFQSIFADRFKFKEILAHKLLILQSSFIGIGIGILPGIGTETACWVAYTAGMKRAKNKEEYGKGEIEGVIAPEAANNAVCGAAMVPLLTFGIPGDVVTAVMLGAFVAQGLRPGPQLFSQNPEIILSLFIAMYIASIAMYTLGSACLPFFIRLLSMKRSILYPSVILFCIAGTFAVRNSFIDVIIMILLGVLGYFARKFNFPVSPIALGFILGGMMEVQFRRSLLMGGGSISIFGTSPIAMLFLVITFVVLGYFLWSQLSGKLSFNRKES